MTRFPTYPTDILSRADALLSSKYPDGIVDPRFVEVACEAMMAEQREAAERVWATDTPPMPEGIRTDPEYLWSFACTAASMAAVEAITGNVTDVIVKAIRGTAEEQPLPDSVWAFPIEGGTE